MRTYDTSSVTFQNKKMELSPKVQNFAPYSDHLQSKLVWNIWSVECRPSDHFVSFGVYLFNFKQMSEMMLHDEFSKCEIKRKVIVVEVLTSSQYFEDQRRSDNSTANILQQQHHRPLPRCRPFISHVSCWLPYSPLSKWNLTPLFRTHL